MNRSYEWQSTANHEMVYKMLSHVPLAIYHIDLEKQRFLMVNDHMCRKVGYSEQELLSLDPLDLLTVPSRELFDHRLNAKMTGESVSPMVDLEFTKKGGDTERGWFYIHYVIEGGAITSAFVVAHNITDPKKNESELANHRLEPENVDGERTGELAKANRRLRKEIEQRAAATEKLRAYSKRLEEMNTAMRVLLDKRNEDYQRAEELIRMNLKELIDPYLERLENSDLRSHQSQLVDVIRSNLNEVIGSATPAISDKFFMFSPNEIQVVNLIRSGRTTKEMARLLNLSTRTIETYRNSIRKKLNLKNKKVNLRTYLSSI